MLNVAIIGMGNIGRTHAGVYQASERAHLAAVCDMDKSIADAAAERFAVPAYYSVSELLDNVELNAVSVTTAGPENGGHHYEPVMQCFDAGLHVLCEKPISNNIEQAREMAARADETGLYFGINLNHRFVPPAARAISCARANVTPPSRATVSVDEAPSTTVAGAADTAKAASSSSVTATVAEAGVPTR